MASGLATLNLFNNQLTGRIPDDALQDRIIRINFENNNGLCAGAELMYNANKDQPAGFEILKGPEC